jgi:hypothetical protein
MVLLAAALAALALIPLVVAYLQLGAHPDVAARTEPDHDTERVVQSLSRAVENASLAVSGEYGSANRSRALARFDRALGPDVSRIEQSSLNESVVIAVSQNTSAARVWADTSCPSGENRQFGGCRVENGVVVQDRVGSVHVLAVALDVRISGPDGTTAATVVFD